MHRPRGFGLPWTGRKAWQGPHQCRFGADPRRGLLHSTLDSGAARPRPRAVGHKRIYPLLHCAPSPVARLIKSYLELIQTILEQGCWQDNCTGLRTCGLPGTMLCFDRPQSVPAMTPKKLDFRTAIAKPAGGLHSCSSVVNLPVMATGSRGRTKLLRMSTAPSFASTPPPGNQPPGLNILRSKGCQRSAVDGRWH